MSNMRNTLSTNIRRQQSGFTLVELMIASTLGLFLLIGLVQLVTNLKQSYRIQGATSRVQETARFAMEFITREARQAGFFGCANAQNIQFTNHVQSGSATTTSSMDISNPLNGANNINAPNPTLDGITLSGAIIETDLFITKSGQPVAGGSVVTTGNSTYTGSASIKIQNATTAKIGQGSVVMVTNCTHADQFAVSNNPQSASTSTSPNNKNTLVHGQNFNQTSKIGVYGAGSEILKMRSTIIYIGTGESGRNALFRKSSGSPAVELVDGVEDMQITYGEDTDPSGSSGYGTPNYYVSAEKIIDMNRVVSMRISLLISTLEDNLTTTAQTYTYNGVAPTTATDKRIYRVYTSTVALRNRLH